MKPAPRRDSRRGAGASGPLPRGMKPGAAVASPGWWEAVPQVRATEFAHWVVARRIDPGLPRVRLR
ncbi:hypothetical protein [Streptomyces sp. NPDC012888]|uniref:hypothetical protein n=1 Tax=Streptomyces sp. NPDC012888 TaxID=3364855 RepID=UPI00368B3F01